VSASSQIPVAKRGLYDALRVAAEPGGPLEGIQVSYGHPGTDRLEKKSVFVDTARAEEEAAGLLGAPRDEDITLELVVLAMHRPNSSELEVEDVLWPIVAAVRDAIYADPTLGDALQNPAGVTRTRQDSWTDPERGWVCRAVLEIGGVGRNHP
jgi:hypothetical protein